MSKRTVLHFDRIDYKYVYKDMPIKDLGIIYLYTSELFNLNDKNIENIKSIFENRIEQLVSLGFDRNYIINPLNMIDRENKVPYSFNDKIEANRLFLTALIHSDTVVYCYTDDNDFSLLKELCYLCKLNIMEDGRLIADKLGVNM